MNSTIEHLKSRYFNEEFQKFRHFGDCHFYTRAKICTCGLIHWFFGHEHCQDVQDLLDETLPNWREDFETHEISLSCIENFRPQEEERIRKWQESDEYKKIMRKFQDGTLYKELGFKMAKEGKDGQENSRTQEES